MVHVFLYTTCLPALTDSFFILFPGLWPAGLASSANPRLYSKLLSERPFALIQVAWSRLAGLFRPKAYRIWEFR